MIWILIIISGLITYCIRASSLIMIKRETLSDEMRLVLSYVPSAVFPAIIFPAIFLNENLTFVELVDPKIIAAIISVITGYISKNIIATIVSGIISYWILIFALI